MGFSRLERLTLIIVKKGPILSLALFRSGGYQIDTCLQFSIYLLHGFSSESEQPDHNRVTVKFKKYIMSKGVELHHNTSSILPITGVRTKYGHCIEHMILALS